MSHAMSLAMTGVTLIGNARPLSRAGCLALGDGSSAPDGHRRVEGASFDRFGTGGNLLTSPAIKRLGSAIAPGEWMDTPRVSTKKELQHILPRLPGWKHRGRLVRAFKFEDFVDSLALVNSRVAYFETMDPPDGTIAYDQVTFELTRYDIGGRVTDHGVHVAKEITARSGARR